MAFLSYTDSGIVFNNITQPSFTTSGRISHTKYNVDENNNIINRQGKTINAIDIDWNGAYLESLDAYINSTADLLNQLNIIARTIALSTNQLNNQFNALDVYTKDESDDKYVSKEEYDNLVEQVEALTLQIRQLQNNYNNGV